MASHRNFGGPAQPGKRNRENDNGDSQHAQKRQQHNGFVSYDMRTTGYAEPRRAELKYNLRGNDQAVDIQTQQTKNMDWHIDSLRSEVRQLQAQKDALAARPDPGLYQLPSNDSKLKVASKSQQDLPMQPANPKYVDVQTQTEWSDHKQAGRPKFIEKLMAERKAKRMEERRRQREQMVARFSAQEAKLDSQYTETKKTLEDEDAAAHSAMADKHKAALKILADKHEVALKTLDGKHRGAFNALFDEYELAVTDLQNRHDEALRAFDNEC